MKVVVSVRDVVNEMDHGMDELTSYLNRRTGELITLSDDDLSAAEGDDDISDYPDWHQEVIRKAQEVIASDEYLKLPSKYEIHEYRIMKDFCYSVEDEDVRDDLLERISGRGAFRSFKDGIHRHDIAEEWYQFREEALEKIAISWLEDNDIPYTRRQAKGHGQQ